MRVSSHVNHQEHVKQQEAAKPCQIGKIVRFLHSKMLPFKKFSGLRPKPRWGAQPPPQRPPHAKHLRSLLATTLTEIQNFDPPPVSTFLSNYWRYCFLMINISIPMDRSFHCGTYRENCVAKACQMTKS